MSLKVIKKDGRKTYYDPSKVRNAIYKAFVSVGRTIDHDIIDNLTEEVFPLVSINDSVSVDEIHNAVERVLIRNNFHDVAKEYILFRNKRSEQRELNSGLMVTMQELTFSDSEDFNLKRENGNIDGDTAMGTMLRYGSETAKKFYKLRLINPKFSRAHDNGDIHIHDLDFFALTETCCQIDIAKLFEDGFSTGHGYLREPSNILTAGALVCIAIQANQNEQHGGQSIPNFDYALAKYVAKTYIKEAKNITNIMMSGPDRVTNTPEGNEVERILTNIYTVSKTIIEKRSYNIAMLEKNIPQIKGYIKLIEGYAWKTTIQQTYQAMEGVIHNLNTMHSRAGAQIPFSSLNYGTCTSQEGRLVIKAILEATWNGLGNGETPVFPIQIFKLKEGVNYNKEDPNYDLFKLACKVSAKRLFPNFSFMDSPFNLQYYKKGHPETEAAYMGCRTRVIGNNYDPNNEITFGRGNLSFTSINLPRLAIESKQEIEREIGDSKFDEIKLRTLFYTKLTDMVNLVFDQLLERFKYQCMKKVKNYPFLMGQGIWIGSDNLGYDDSVAEVLKNGSLTVGFIGLAECLKMLIGEHHGESEKAQKFGFGIIEHMRKMADEKSKETGLNFTLIATPAEGLSGRFVRIDKKKYGIIPGVTDRDYYTNSFHIPVYYPIDMYRKINIEAPYHELTNGGHITYIEYDGDPLDNLEAFEQIVRMAHDAKIGYFAINHAVDHCGVCGYTGIIGDSCPICGNNGSDYVEVDKLYELSKKYPFIRIPRCCKADYAYEMEDNNDST